MWQPPKGRTSQIKGALCALPQNPCPVMMSEWLSLGLPHLREDRAASKAMGTLPSQP